MSPSKADWAAAYANHEEEEAYEVPLTDIDGHIPAELCGTLFRNGPGRVERSGHVYAHLFDGDGMVTAFAIRDGRVHVRNAFVRTAEFEEEEAAGRVLWRNTFGTQPRGGWRANAFNVLQKNVANTNVIYFGGRLLCLWEAAQPYRLDPRTLRTLGLETLGGLLQRGMPFTSGIAAVDRLAAGVLGDPLTAHPKLDVPRAPPPAAADDDAPRAAAAAEARGTRLVTFGFRAKASAAALAAGRGPFDSELTLYEFDEAWRVAARRAVGVDGFAFVHDFVVTEHYALWFQSPCDFAPLRYVLGEKNPAQLIGYDAARPTLVHVVPRDAASGRRRRRLELPASFVFHHARGYEVDGGAPGRERLVVDSVVLESFPAFDGLTRPPDDADGAALRRLDFGAQPSNRLVRFELDLAAPAAAAAAQATPRPRAAEFPCVGAVAPRAPHRLVFGACAAHASRNGPLQGVVRLDMASGEEVAHFPGPRLFANEPVFVPRAGAAAEDDGWLLVVFFDAARRRCGLFVYDAARLDDGPLGVAWLRRGQPYGLHGNWVEGETFGWLED